MSSVQSQDETAAQLLTFIRNSFLAGDPEGELDQDTPLLEYGILNSLNTAELLVFLRDDLGVDVPFDQVTAQTFRSVSTVTSMVIAVRTAGS